MEGGRPCRLLAVLIPLAVVSSPGCGDPTSPPPQLCSGITDKPACVSSCGDGGAIIDLTPLVPNKNASARFTNIINPDKDNTYQYNPCYPFNYKKCKNVNLCFVGIGDNLQESLGDGGTEKMMIGSDNVPYLHYTSPDPLDPAANKALVYLNCTDIEEPSITFWGSDIMTGTYMFNLSTCHACPGGCASRKKPTTEIPVGYVGIAVLFLIISAVVVYCVVGSILLRVEQKEDYIPNQRIWTGFFMLIKDGCCFALQPIIIPISRRIRRRSYETIQDHKHRYT